MSPDLCGLPFSLPDADAGHDAFVAFCGMMSTGTGRGATTAGGCAAPHLPEGFSLQTLAALRRLAHERAAQGRADEASSLFRIVTDFLPPGAALALVHIEHARTLAHFTRHEQALDVFDAVLHATPGPAETGAMGDAPAAGVGGEGACDGAADDNRIAALAGKAMSLAALSRGEEALALLDRHADLRRADRAGGALAAWDLARTYVFLGLHRPLEAMDAVGRVLCRTPQDNAALLAKAAILLRLQRPMQAVGELEGIFARDPDHAAALVLFGQALAALGEFGFAVDRFERALQVAPRYAPAYRYMASALCMQRMDDAALVCLRAARALQPDWPLAWLDEAGIRLRRGELARGFAAYEWREGARWAARQGARHWNGDEPLDTLSLLVVAEQGLGDTLQFVRFLPSVAKLARSVVLEVQAPLRRLIAAQAARWGVQVIQQGDPRPDTDRFTLLMSLPHALRTRLDTIPAETPYLALLPRPLEQMAGQTPEQVPEQVPELVPELVPKLVLEQVSDRASKQMSDRMSGACPGAAASVPGSPRTLPLRVGIVPSGNPHFADDALRSMPLALLAPVLRMTGVDAVLLQPAPREADRAWATTHAPTLRVPPRLGDFLDTAEQVASLDLVISVDTAVAHLAGALGRPVWILLPFLADWRWMSERRDSPWYPSATLFRQAAPHDWHSVAEAVRAALAGLIAARQGARTAALTGPVSIAS